MNKKICSNDHLKFFLTKENSIEMSLSKCGAAINCDSLINNRNVELSIVGCHFERNHNDGIGSSIYVNIQSDVTIDNRAFTENIAANDGSVYIDPDVEGNTKTFTIIISNCRFNKNQAHSYLTKCNKSNKDEKGDIYLDNI